MNPPIIACFLFANVLTFVGLPPTPCATDLFLETAERLCPSDIDLAFASGTHFGYLRFASAFCFERPHFEKDPSGIKRKDFKGRKPAAEGGPMDKEKKNKKENSKENSIELIKRINKEKKEALERMKKELGMKAGGRAMRAGGGLMEATQRLRRQGLKRGGRGCKLAMKGRGRAYGKNS